MFRSVATVRSRLHQVNKRMSMSDVCDPRCNKYVETQEVCEPKMSCVPKDPNPPCITLPRPCPRPMPCDLEFYKLKKPVPSSRVFKCGKKVICEDTYGLEMPVKSKYLTDISISARGPSFRDPYMNNMLY